MKGTELIHLE